MEEHTKAKRVWYLFLMVVYTIAYVIKAIAEGIWGWLKSLWDKRK